MEMEEHVKQKHLLVATVLSIFIVCTAATTGATQSNERFKLTWLSILNGGGTSSGERFAVQDVIGEFEIGETSGGAYSITSEFAGRQTLQNLVLIYVSADNDLAGEVEELVGKVQRGAVGANAVIYLLFDRPADTTSSQLYQIAKRDPENCNVFSEPLCKKEDPTYIETQHTWIRNGSMGLSSTLKEFLAFTISRHPDAKNIILSMVGHGSGWSPDTLEPQPGNHVGQPGGGLLWDKGGGDGAETFFSTHELGQALAEAKAQTERQVDLLYLDACLMGMWEVAYEIKDSVRYLLASESWSWTSFAYDQHLQDLHDSPDVPEIGRRWMENEIDILGSDQHGFTYSLLNLNQATNVREAIDQLASALDPNDMQIKDVLSPDICFDSDWDSRITDIDNYCDLYSFANRLHEQYGQNLAIVEASNAVMEAVTEMIPDGYSTFTRGIDPNQDAKHPKDWNWNNLGGVSIYLPLKNDEWKRRYYRDSASKPLRASVDGQWDEFLDDYWNKEPPSDPLCEEGKCAVSPSPLRIPPKYVFLPLITN